MSEKFRKVVNWPHKTAGQGRKAIQNTRPKSAVGKTLKGAGVTTMGLIEFVAWLGKYAAADNHLVRAWERKFAATKVGKKENGKDKKLAAFVKKNPNFSSLVSYYTLLAGLALATAVYFGRGDGGNDEEKEMIELAKQEYKVKPNTYGAYLERMRPLEPFLIIDFMVKEGIKTDPETGLCIPYLDSRGVWTIGYGSTFIDGHAVTKNTRHITKEEAWNLAIEHLENETFFVLYCYDVAFDAVNVNDVNMARGLASIMYNTYNKLIEVPKPKKGKDTRTSTNNETRFAKLREYYNQYGLEVPDSLVQKAFAEYPVTDATSFGEAFLSGASANVLADKLGGFLLEGGGIYWRRWLESETFRGFLLPHMALDVPMFGMYEFYKNNREGREPWFSTDRNGDRHVNHKTWSEFVAWLDQPVDKNGYSMKRWAYGRVRDNLTPEALAMVENGRCEFGCSGDINKTYLTPIKAADYTKVAQVATTTPAEEESRVSNVPQVRTDTISQTEYDAAYNSAMAEYNAGNYESAMVAFKAMVAKQPNKASLRNDLAICYIKLERYDDAIAQARYITRIIGDESQAGVAFYNAGLAYEKKGNRARAYTNYELAVKKGNLAGSKGMVRCKPNTDSKAQKKKSKSGTRKKQSFKKATGRAKQNGFMRGLTRFNNGNGMA